MLGHERPQGRLVEINSTSEFDMTPKEKTQQTEHIELASRGANGPYVTFKVSCFSYPISTLFLIKTVEMI